MVEHDDIWAAALQEAYASAPTDEVILSTLELRHPSFIEDGQLTAVRVISEFGTLLEESEDPDVEDVYGWELKLEDNAPVQAGQTVKFVSCQFSITKPEQNENELPTFNIAIDNVSRLIMQYLDDALAYRAKLELTYREYLASDVLTPSFILGGASLKDVKCNNARVTGTARFADLVNKTFPGKVYRPNEFRGLVQ